MPIIEKDDKIYMTDDIYIHKVTSSIGINYPEHKHDFFEMVYIAKGKCVQTIDEERFYLHHGDMLLVNYNQSHSISGDSECEYIDILLKPEYINASLANSENAFALLNLSEFSEFSKMLDENKRQITFSGEERIALEGIINSIDKELGEKCPGFELVVRSLLNQLLISVFRKMSLKMEESITSVSERLLKYINLHCHEKLTLSFMACKCSYNPSYFSRIFKDYTGMNFTSYLRYVRIQKAAKMLTDTDKSVGDILYEVGYTDRTKFFSHFKSIMGQSPLSYRKSKK